MGRDDEQAKTTTFAGDRVHLPPGRTESDRSLRRRTPQTDSSIQFCTLTFANVHVVAEWEYSFEECDDGATDRSRFDEEDLVHNTHRCFCSCVLAPLGAREVSGGGGGVRAAARFGKKKRSRENRKAPPPVSHVVDVSISSCRHLWLMV